MGQDLSLRPAAYINALPARQGMCVLKIGYGRSPRLRQALNVRLTRAETKS